MAIKKDQKPQRTHNGIAIDSDEEWMMLMWAEEMIERGLLESVERAEPFLLSSAITNTYKETVELKTKTKEVEKKQKLLEEHVYTPEFKIIPTEEGYKKLVYNPMLQGGRKNTKLFIGDQMNGIYIEIKPEWDQNNMERLFKINQKWVADKYGIIVNLIKPIQLYEKTFVPDKYLITSTGKKRTIHIPIRSIDQYIETL